VNVAFFGRCKIDCFFHDVSPAGGSKSSKAPGEPDTSLEPLSCSYDPAAKIFLYVLFIREDNVTLLNPPRDAANGRVTE